MVIFHSYVKLPDGNDTQWLNVNSKSIPVPDFDDAMLLIMWNHVNEFWTFVEILYRRCPYRVPELLTCAA